MSTTCVQPRSVAGAFSIAERAGFDGVEIMVTQDPATRDARGLQDLSQRHGLPILSIHAPVLLFTQHVWGVSPRVKLEKAAEMARAVGASTVVVHPPFLWEPVYAVRFPTVVRDISERYGVEIAVENMFGWKWKALEIRAFAPTWDPVGLDVDAATLDFSHYALAGRDSLERARELGPRLRHVHLCDGAGSAGRSSRGDQHLIPGRGTQPVAETLAWLAANSWSGSVVAEINTRSAADDAQRVEMLREVLRYAREHSVTRSPELRHEAG